MSLCNAQEAPGLLLLKSKGKNETMIYFRPPFNIIAPLSPEESFQSLPLLPNMCRLLQDKATAA